MTVMRVKKTENYVMLHKGALEDPNLSFKAKGLWAYCLSRKDNWEFHVSHLATVSKDGEDAVYSAIKELQKAGYVKKVQKNENGVFQTVDYEIYEIPQIQIILPQPDFPYAGNPHAGNPALVSNDSLVRIEDKSKREQKSATPPTPAFFSNHKNGRIKIRNDLLDALYADFGEKRVLEYMDKLDEFADINPKRFKQYANHATVLRKWIREDDEKKQNAPNSRSKASNLISRVKEVLSHYQHPLIEVGADYVRVTKKGTNFSDTFYDGDKNFDKNVIHTFRKLNAPPSVLEYLEGKRDKLE